MNRRSLLDQPAVSKHHVLGSLDATPSAGANSERLGSPETPGKTSEKSRRKRWNSGPSALPDLPDEEKWEWINWGSGNWRKGSSVNLDFIGSWKKTAVSWSAAIQSGCFAPLKPVDLIFSTLMHSDPSNPSSCTLNLSSDSMDVPAMVAGATSRSSSVSSSGPRVRKSRKESSSEAYSWSLKDWWVFK